MKKSIVILALLPLMFACETDIEVAAEYKEVTNVFGLLDAGDSRHFVRINRSFLTDESATEAAIQRENSEYETIDATIIEVRDGTTTRSWSLKDTIVPKDEGGDFFSGDQRVFYFDAQLVRDADYDLKITNNSGEEVTSTTEIITYDQFQFISQSVSRPFERPTSRPLELVDGGELKTAYSFDIFAVPTATLYEVTISMNYVDVFADGTKELKTLVISRTTDKEVTSGERKKKVISIDPETVFTTIVDNLPSLPAGVSERHFIEDDVDFGGTDQLGDATIKVTAAEKNLATYIEIAQPSTSIVQDRDVFTNVDNGIGLWSARATIIAPKHMTSETKNALTNNEIRDAQDLGLCVQESKDGSVKICQFK